MAFSLYNKGMDYEQYTLNSYTIPSSELDTDTFVFFYSDGSYLIQDNTGFDNAYDNIWGLQYFGANYSNRFGNENASLVSFCYCFAPNDMLFCHTNRLEYAVFGSSGATGGLVGYKFVEGDALDDLTTITNYWNASGENPFSDFEDEGSLYGQYRVTLTSQRGYAVFDYTNIKYGELESPYEVIRGENMTFYTYVTEFNTNSIPNNYYFAYGAPTLSRYEEGREAGYRDGYTAGWINGNDNGYQVGINSQGGSVEQSQATAFTYIEGAFNVVGSVMSLEVLPNVTLGLVWSIPLVFILIMTIFKLVRK